MKVAAFENMRLPHRAHRVGTTRDGLRNRNDVYRESMNRQPSVYNRQPSVGRTHIMHTEPALQYVRRVSKSQIVSQSSMRSQKDARDQSMNRQQSMRSQRSQNDARHRSMRSEGMNRQQSMRSQKSSPKPLTRTVTNGSGQFPRTEEQVSIETSEPQITPNTSFFSSSHQNNRRKESGFHSMRSDGSAIKSGQVQKMNSSYVSRDGRPSNNKSYATNKSNNHTYLSGAHRPLNNVSPTSNVSGHQSSYNSSSKYEEEYKSGTYKNSGSGQQSGSGPDSSRPSGHISSRPSGEQSGSGPDSSRPSGNISSRPSGEQSKSGHDSSRPSGKESSRPSGHISSRPSGEQSKSGYDSSRPSGDGSQVKDGSYRPSGKSGKTGSSSPHISYSSSSHQKIEKASSANSSNSNQKIERNKNASDNSVDKEFTAKKVNPDYEKYYKDKGIDPKKKNKSGVTPLWKKDNIDDAVTAYYLRKPPPVDWIDDEENEEIDLAPYTMKPTRVYYPPYRYKKRYKPGHFGDIADPNDPTLLDESFYHGPGRPDGKGITREDHKAALKRWKLMQALKGETVSESTVSSNGFSERNATSWNIGSDYSNPHPKRRPRRDIVGNLIQEADSDESSTGDSSFESGLRQFEEDMLDELGQAKSKGSDGSSSYGKQQSLI